MSNKIEESLKLIGVQSKDISDILSNIPPKILKLMDAFEKVEIQDVLKTLVYIHVTGDIYDHEGGVLKDDIQNENLVNILLQLGLIEEHSWHSNEIIIDNDLGYKIATKILKSKIEGYNFGEIEEKCNPIVLGILREQIKKIESSEDLSGVSFDFPVSFNYSSYPCDNGVFSYSFNKLSFFSWLIECNEIAFNKFKEFASMMVDEGIIGIATGYNSKGSYNKRYYVIPEEETNDIYKAIVNKLGKTGKKIDAFVEKIERKCKAAVFLYKYNPRSYSGLGDYRDVKDEIISYLNTFGNSVVVYDNVFTKGFSKEVPFLVRNKTLYDKRLKEIEEELIDEVMTWNAKLETQEKSENAIKNESVSSSITTNKVIIDSTKNPLKNEDILITFPPYAAELSNTRYIFGRNELEGKLAFGYEIDDNGQVNYDKLLTIDLFDINKPHFGAFQKTRSGKSTLAGNILLQAAFQGVPVVIFDPKPDYVSNIIPISTTLERRSDDKSGIISRFNETKQDMRGFDFTKKIPFKFNNEEWFIEFQVYSFDEKLGKLPNCKILKIPLVSLPPRDPQNFEDICNSIATNLANAISIATRDGSAIKLNFIISKIIQKFLKENPERNEMFYDDFQKMIEDEIDHTEDDKKVLIKLKGLLESFKTSQSFLLAKNEEETLDFKELIKNPLDINGDKKTVSISVIDISSLPQDEKSPILSNYVSGVCTQIFNFVRKMSVNKSIKVLLIFDEAQNYLPDPTDTFNSIRRILTGGASYGIKAWVIAQSPENIDKEARKQLTTFICAKVSEQTIRDDISMYLNDEDDSWTKKLKNTKLGKALIFNDDTKPSSGKLCLTFTTPQTVDLLSPEQIVEIASKKDK